MTRHCDCAACRPHEHCWGPSRLYIDLKGGPPWLAEDCTLCNTFSLRLAPGRDGLYLLPGDVEAEAEKAGRPRAEDEAG